MERNKLFLYAGLSLLLVAFIGRWAGMPLAFQVSTFALAILLKAIFLLNVFRAKDFHMSLWLGLILAGVALILISLLFKTVFPVPLVRNILFYSAIALKLGGLLLLLIGKRTQNKIR